MLMQWMPVHIRQAPKAFEAPVHSFITYPGQGIHFLFGILVSSLHLSQLSSIVIPSISHIAFMVLQVVINSNIAIFQSSHSPIWNGPFTQTIHLDANKILHL